MSVTALEDCTVLVWHRDKLKFQMMSDPFLQAVFDHVLGRDVVKKLMQVSAIKLITVKTAKTSPLKLRVKR